MKKIKHWLRLIRCVLFHKKVTLEKEFFDGILVWGSGIYRGCKQCDLWRLVSEK